MTYPDDLLKLILRRTRVIACVGVSMNPVRPSYFVARYLGLKGYRVIPVNPGHTGKILFNEVIQPDLASIPAEAGVDFVDIFRRSEAVPGIVDEALAHLPAAKDDLDADWRRTPRGSGQGRGCGCHGDPEPVPKDRIPAAFRRVADGWVQYRSRFVAALVMSAYTSVRPRCLFLQARGAMPPVELCQHFVQASTSRAASMTSR